MYDLEFTDRCIMPAVLYSLSIIPRKVQRQLQTVVVMITDNKTLSDPSKIFTNLLCGIINHLGKM